MKYVKNNYIIFEHNINDIINKCKLYNINKYEIDDDGLLIVMDSVIFKNHDFKKLPLKFKEVYYDFIIISCCVASLEGSPTLVGRNYIVEKTNIENLIYSPIEVNGEFTISGNKYLVRPHIFPKYIYGNVCVDNCDLTSLYGFIDEIKKSVSIINNKRLKTLKYGPKYVNENCYYSYCGLKTLYGSPNFVGGDFYCNNNKLTNIKHSPRIINGNFIVWDNSIYSLYGFPDYVGGFFDCTNNPVYKIYKLFNNKEFIEYFNQMNIIKNINKININKLNTFLKYVGVNPVKDVDGYVNIH